MVSEKAMTELRGLVAKWREHAALYECEHEPDIAGTLVRCADELEAALAAMAAQGEASELLRGMGLDPERFRTEGGRMNPAKVRAAIRHPESYAGLYLPKEDA